MNIGYVCTLPEGVKKKDCSGCEGCGWERTERDRRRAYIKEHGLTLCTDGLRRLIMKKEESEMVTPSVALALFSCYNIYIDRGLEGLKQ